MGGSLRSWAGIFKLYIGSPLQDCLRDGAKFLHYSLRQSAPISGADQLGPLSLPENRYVKQTAFAILAREAVNKRLRSA
jgi:hypothetical protein